MNKYPKVNINTNFKFQSDYINDINGWGFSDEFIKQNYGKLLTLDIDFGIQCSLNCPHCFRKSNNVDDLQRGALSFTELKKTLLEAKELGLRSIKFLGKGEPFENPLLIDLLKFLKQINITPLIFTKGHIIGDDNKISQNFSDYSIYNHNDLLNFLNDVNASIMVGFNSYKQKLQDELVGNVKGYTLVRNKAIELLCEYGFNKENPTRLGIVVSPVTKFNINEAINIYKWARLRNIYVAVGPTMISGRANVDNYWKEITPNYNDLIELYTNIYLFNIEKGIQTIESIESDGISSYAGGRPCNQISVGLYMTLNGIILRCPGDDVTILGNLKEKKLKEIWNHSENYGRCGQYNCKCPPKWGKSFPFDFFDKVKQNIYTKLRIK